MSEVIDDKHENEVDKVFFFYLGYICFIIRDVDGPRLCHRD